MKETFHKYLNIIIIWWTAALLLRLAEAGTLLMLLGNEDGMLVSELTGFAMDIVIGSAILLLFFPLYYLFARHFPKTTNSIFLTILCLFAVIHLLLLQYFFNQHKMLDSLLFGYSWDEIVNTVGTANVSITKIVVEIVVVVALLLLSYFLIRKRHKSRILSFIALASLPIAVILILLKVTFYNNYAANKSYYFYKSAIKYKTTEKQYCHALTPEDIAGYQSLFPKRKFVSDTYPLLHEFATSDSLGSFFDNFDSKPNVVIILAEGLNDDFVHDYHGLNLTPKLRSLIGQSLYWDHCFTLGERSYAVVPSLLGSLPYGKIGFTLLERLPRHLSLVSILKANGWQTDFFYGQGSWFHRKDRFFKRNNIDLIFDDAVYAEKYEKIIVGSNEYFWGYNDRDLFNQSLEVVDTLDSRPRLDIFFTGSMHSPFMIPDAEHYDKRLAGMVQELENSDERKYFEIYNDYARSILFFDDALADFIHHYSQRDDYQNTIFVITGDHPMSEIPPENTFKKYHVPLIIYSPGLKAPAVFHNTVSHLDFYESMLAFMEKYEVGRPSHSASMGSNLFEDNENIAFMDESRDVKELYSNGYFVNDSNIYKITEGFGIQKINDPEKYNELIRRLDLVRRTSEYTSLENYIVPAVDYCEALGLKPIEDLDHSGDTVYQAKYTTIIKKVDVTDYDTVLLDLSFGYKGFADNCVVCDISDEEGNNLYYRANYMGGDDVDFAIFQYIPVTHGKGKTLLKVYFCNEVDDKCLVSDINGLLAGKIRSHSFQPSNISGPK